VLRGLQSLSLLYSTGFLFFALWTLRLLGQMAKPHFPLNSAALFIAVYPGTMLSTVRISNDSLAQLLIAATITLAVRWWMKGDNTSWYSAIAVLGAAMLTKSNAMIIAPLPFILLCFFPFLTWREKLRLGGAAAVLLVLFYGWYFVEREYVQKQEFFIGNLPVMNRALFVEDDWSSYLVFNPRAVLEIPYVNTFTDQSRRRFTWEFWYRSSFFGEYQFPGFNEHLRTTLLVSGMALYLLAALGVILYLRGSRHQALPMFIVLSLFCIGEIASRVKVPLAGAAEFRYTVFAVIPAAYFFAAAIRQNRLLHLMGLLLMIAFAVSAVSFLGYLYLSPGQASIPELNLFG
ncbi:MAG TPA: hypothetical protein PLP17_01100, partial [Oligoflexia bacterium]|nr:hypothetical protein [Oligoflexia bacterium]